MTIVSGVLMCIPAVAQLNESDTARFQFRVGATGAWQRGNVDLVVLRGRLELVTNSRNPFVFKSQNNSLYQAFSGYKADNDINSRNYFYYHPFHTVYPFGMVYAQTNFRRQIDFRWFGGAGATCQLVQKPTTNLKLSVSLVYESTNFRNAEYNEVYYNGSNDIHLWRTTVYLAGWHHIFNHHLKLFYSAYWQPGLDEVTNHRAQVDVGIDFPVWKGLNMVAQYSYTYEQVVASTIRQHDRIFTFGISYQFKN
ncbi:MAG: DUF481 domain-containing protein [Cyclobacteriaceae bacterium]|nr:DUF481 domain-containing protein [Cyclobacteriaceae bacterium]